MTPEEMTKIVEEHLAAENRGDVEAAVSFFHDECFYELVALGIRFEGRQGVALQYAALFNTFPDAELTIDGASRHDLALFRLSRFDLAT